MAQENFNVSLPNDGLGDALRDAFIKQQSMNTELYTTKVDKVSGKDLSTNDFTNALKSKLDGIENFADVNVQSDWLQTDDTADDYIKNKPSFAGLVPDGFILAETTLVDQEFIINAAQWYVNSQLNILPFSFPALSFEIPLAGTGLQRSDLFYGTNIGIIERIIGEEDVIAVEPTLPPNCVRLTAILTNDTASTPPPPIDLSGFIEKQSFAYLPLSSLGGAPVTPVSLNFITTDGDGVTGFSGFQSGSVFVGQRMIIRNDKTTDFELTPAGLFDFTFDQNYTIKAGDNIEFDFTASGFRQVGSLQDLQSVTEKGNSTDQDVYFTSVIFVDTIKNNAGVSSIRIQDEQIIFSVKDGKYFATPTDEPTEETRTIATREWVADNALSVTQTSQLTNDGSDGTSTYVETDELGAVAFSNDYNDLDNLPTIPSAYVHPNHSGDVTSVGDGVQTIANQAVTNAKFRDSTAHTVVGRAGSGNGSVSDITLGNNTILGREESGSVEGLSVTQVQSMINFDSKQNNSIYITADTAAVNNGRYIANGILTITDITSPVAGSNYEVVVRGGAVTIDGVAFDAGSTIRRVHNGTSWQEYYFNPLPLVFTGASDLTTSRLWNNRIVKIVNTAPITVTLNDDIECSGNQESILDITFVSGNRVALPANGTLILSSSVAGSLFMLSRANASGTPTTRVYLNTL